jgi:hypothetical protein
VLLLPFPERHLHVLSAERRHMEIKREKYLQKEPAI